MITAMEAVETGVSVVNRAAVDHGVPNTILTKWTCEAW